MTAGLSPPVPQPEKKTRSAAWMSIPPPPSTISSTAGKTYYFCCGGCLEKFRADPDRYLNPKTSANLVQLGTALRSSRLDAAGTHVDIRRASASTSAPCAPRCASRSPAPVPSCGMALEPESPFPIPRPNTPARCIRKSCAPSRAAVPSAAWRSSRAPSPRAKKRIPNCAT